MKKHVKIAVTGAAGQIGYALLFRVASGQMFGPDVTIDLHLLERPEVLPALEGVRMELQDCAFPLLHNIVCTANVVEAMRDVNWALLVGAVPRKAGMERGDLLAINGKIFTAQGRAINDHAAEDVRVLVVGNPCNTNCLITMHHAKDVPHDRFYAMTALDEKRAIAQLALKANVPVTAVKRMIIWGNHSATQYPDFFNAMINGVPAPKVMADHAWLEGDFIGTVQKRGAAIIKARGLSSAASAANAIVSTVYRLSHDSQAGELYSVALCSAGQYGVDEGLIYSFPCYTKDNCCHVLTDVQHEAFAQNKLNATLEELRVERETVKQLGLFG